MVGALICVKAVGDGLARARLGPVRISLGAVSLEFPSCAGKSQNPTSRLPSKSPLLHGFFDAINFAHSLRDVADWKLKCTSCAGCSCGHCS